MAKKNDYWEERTRKRRAALDRDVEKANKELIDNFETALKDVQAKINHFWIKYAENNEITLSQAQQLLSLKEWRAFKGTLEEFQQLAKDSIGTFNLELENLSMRARISRYQELELNVKSVLDQLYQKQNEVIGRTASDAYMDQYFHSLFNIEQYKGVHTDFMIPNAKAIEELVKYPFNGADYSERLWRHQEDLTFKLKEALTNMFVEGKNPYDYKDKFASLFQVKRSEAYRLLDTEHAYVAEAASQAAYEADGIEEYKINATLDTKTSKICRGMDGKIFKVSERKEGKNCPPFHPYCRTTTEPYIPELADIQTTRVAKNADGKNIYVPADMTYDEWYEKYAANSEKRNKLKEFYATDDEHVKMKVKAEENKISGNAIEKAIVYDSKGNVLLEKLGKEAEVEFTDAEFKLMKNAVVTHNHPMGTTLSPDDIYRAIEYDLQEIRAVGKQFTYILRRNENLHLMPSQEDFEDEYKFILGFYSEAYVKKFRNKDNFIHYQRTIQNNAMQKMAEKYGLLYWREKNEIK